MSEWIDFCRLVERIRDWYIAVEKAEVEKVVTCTGRICEKDGIAAGVDESE